MEFNATRGVLVKFGQCARVGHDEMLMAIQALANEYCNTVDPLEISANGFIAHAHMRTAEMISMRAPDPDMALYVSWQGGDYVILPVTSPCQFQTAQIVSDLMLPNLVSTLPLPWMGGNFVIRRLVTDSVMLSNQTEIHPLQFTSVVLQLMIAIQSLHSRGIICIDTRLTNIAIDRKEGYAQLVDLLHSTRTLDTSPYTMPLNGYTPPEKMINCPSFHTPVELHMLGDMWRFGITVLNMFVNTIQGDVRVGPALIRADFFEVDTHDISYFDFLYGLYSSHAPKTVKVGKLQFRFHLECISNCRSYCLFIQTLVFCNHRFMSYRDYEKQILSFAVEEPVQIIIPDEISTFAFKIALRTHWFFVDHLLELNGNGLAGMFWYSMSMYDAPMCWHVIVRYVLSKCLRLANYRCKNMTILQQCVLNLIDNREDFEEFARII